MVGVPFLPVMVGVPFLLVLIMDVPLLVSMDVPNFPQILMKVPKFRPFGESGVPTIGGAFSCLYVMVCYC
jgi:hypothetical protein